MRVLLGIGGGERSDAALEEAIERAREAGDDLTIAVFEREDADRTRADVEAAVRDRLVETELDPEIRRVEGQSGAQLVELADGEGFDRLVLAGGEVSPLGKIILDDTLEFVLLNSETTVTLVR